MSVDKVESLLERSRPAPPPPELRRRLLEAAERKLPSLPVSPRKPRLLEVLTVAASILMLVATVSWLLREPASPATSPAQSFEERRLAELLPGGVKEFGWSPDGKHWACISPEKKEVSEVLWVVIDGKREAGYSNATLPSFGAGGHYAYTALIPERGWILLLDGKAQDRYQNYDTFAWSPDGKKLAYSAWKKEQKVVVVDGKEYGPYDDVWDLQWSPDGATSLFTAKLQNDWFCVVNGRRGEPCDAIRDPRILPDGKTLTFCANEGDWSVVVGATRGPEFSTVGTPVFSADGRTFGYAAENEEGTYLIIGTLGGRHEKKTEAMEQIGAPVCTRDGTVWAFRGKARNRPKELVFIGRSNPSGGAFSWEGGDGYDSVSDPALSPDGTRVAYAAGKGLRQYLVLDGQRTVKFSLIDRISFSPSGKSVAFRAGQYAKQLVVAGESRSDEFDEVVSGPLWSADGKKVSFTARNGAELWTRVLDVK